MQASWKRRGSDGTRRGKAEQVDWFTDVAREWLIVSKKWYRMDIHSFHTLLTTVEDDIETKNMDMAHYSAGSEVCTEV